VAYYYSTIMVTSKFRFVQGQRANKGKVTSWNDFYDVSTESELMEATPSSSDSSVDGWDLIEHPSLPPPSHSEDVEHWARAMIIDATK